MKLLLLDRPDVTKLAYRRDIEFFGPWAQPIRYPEDLRKPRFEPYPTAESVRDAAIRSLIMASNIFDVLFKIMPDLTGIAQKPERFWRIQYGDLVLKLCGMAEDISARSLALPEEDYILGLPSDDSPPEYSRSWSETMSLLSPDDRFRVWVTSLVLSRRFVHKEHVNYQYHTFRSPNNRPQWLRRVRKLINNPYLLLDKWKKIIRINISPLFYDPNKVHSLVWDHPHLFSSLRNHSFIFKENLFNERKTPLSLTRDIDYDKREQIRNAIPFPMGDLLALAIPVSGLEGLKDLIDSIDQSKLKKYGFLKRVYSNDWNILMHDEYWRAVAALLASHGVKYIAIQPVGMNYFSAPVLFFVGFIFDSLISCGTDDWSNWYLHDHDKYSLVNPRPLPDLMLSRLPDYKTLNYKKNNRRKKWKVIIVDYSENKGIKWLYSPLFPDLAYDYFKRQRTLFEFFNDHQDTMVKLYPIEYGWNNAEWIMTRWPNLHCEYEERNLTDYIVDTEISIITYSSTAFQEVLTMGSPFLCTWNRRWFRGNDLFEQCIDILEESGIFYEDPNKLIEDYRNSIQNNAIAWWNTGDKLQVVRQVAGKIALSSKTAGSQWEKELSRIPA